MTAHNDRALSWTANKRPVLHLSGPRLTSALNELTDRAEAQGGIEAYAEALKYKADLFDHFLSGGKASQLTEDDFFQLCAFMATVRRRVGKALDQLGFPLFHSAVCELIEASDQPADTDAMMGKFVAAFPSDKNYRWVRDLAAEVLHNLQPEKYPLMTKWVWDFRTNTGVMREIWHGDNVDHMTIDVADGYATFVMLREELSQFLSDNGVFRDMLQYVDLLQAKIYADYISLQGGSYLRTDFSTEADPMEHVRRILGLDGSKRSAVCSRMKTIESESKVISEFKRLS